MSTYTRKSFPGRHNIPGQRQENVYTQVQRSGVSCGKVDEEGHPFPNKPVYHRRTVSPRTQEDSFELHDFEKLTITKQPKGLFLPQECDLNGNRKTSESQHPSKVSDRLSSGELQMAEVGEIHAKKLMVQEKLRRVEEITRLKIQRGSGETVAVNDETNEKDFKLIRRKQDQSNEDRMRNAHEEEGARLKRRTYTADKKEVSGEQNKSKWKNVTEHTRGKSDEKDEYIKGQARVRRQDGIERAKERGHNKTSVEKSVWPRQKENMEKMYKDMQRSYDEHDIRHISQEEGAQCRTSGESTFPLAQRKELGHMGSTNTNTQRVICTVCNRRFNSDRLEKHVQICKKVNQSRRQVFNSYVNRTKGSAIEEFWKTHSRSKTPEKKTTRQNHKANITG